MSILKLNILVIGKNGQVASAFYDISKKYPNYNFYFTSRHEIDLAKPDSVFNNLNTLDFSTDIIINCAAYTAVDKAEEEQELADKINHLSVAEIAKYCLNKNIPLIHYSTDYVFNGGGTEPFTEEDSKNLHPLNIYGKTKLDGENAIKNSGCNYIIVRTSSVYSHVGHNFVKTILKLMQERELLNIIHNQVSSPTYAPDLAEATIKLIEKLDLKNNSVKEIYNITSGDYISWFNFAEIIYKNAKERNYNLKIKEIKPIKSEEYITAAIRPKNSKLSSKKLARENIFLPDIKISLYKMFDLI